MSVVGRFSESRSMTYLVVNAIALISCIPLNNGGIYMNKNTQSKESTLCLGYSALGDWERLLIKEGFINSFIDPYKLGYEELDFAGELLVEDYMNLKIYNRDFLLFSMVLFDKISSTNITDFKLDKLIESGIVAESSRKHEQEIMLPDSFSHIEEQISEPTNRSDVIQSLTDVAEIIMREKKSTILAAIKNRAFAKEQIYDKLQFNNVRDERCKLKTISHNYCRLIKDCETWGSSLDNDKDLLGIIKECIIIGLYESQQNNSIYYDGIITQNRTKRIIENRIEFDANDILSVMNIDLSPCLYHLPVPTTMNEVLMLRKRPEIISFRKVFFEWCSLIRKCDFKSVERINKDIALAQKGLEKYYKWENSKTKSFNCLIDAVLSQIPYLSNILGSITPFSTKSILKTRQDNSWVLLLR